MTGQTTSNTFTGQDKFKHSGVNGNGTKKPVPGFTTDFFTGDTITEDVLNNDSQTSSIEPPADFEKNVFIPSWDNRPEDVKAIVSLHGAPILTYQNTSGIIAAPGMGKSSLTEAAAASFLNPNADTLGIKISEDCEGVLIIDNERTTHDVWNSFYRMGKRAGLAFGSAITKNLTIAGLRAVPRLKERIATIEFLLLQKKYSLLILDGAGDLVTDSNDLLQAIECRIWLRELTMKYGLSILTTLHPNPNTNKPRGHIGSEVHRECECVLLAKSIDGNTRILTSDFEFGKNRNHAHVTGAYQWSDEAKMFVTADVDSIAEVKEKAKGNRKRLETERLFLKIIPPPKSLKHTDLLNAIMEDEECKESTAKSRIKDLIDMGFIKKHEDGLYRGN